MYLTYEFGTCVIIRLSRSDAALKCRGGGELTAVCLFLQMNLR